MFGRSAATSKPKPCFRETKAVFSRLSVYLVQVALDFLVAQFIVHQVSRQVLVIRGHVDEPVAGEVEEDDLLLARLLAAVGPRG